MVSRLLLVRLGLFGFLAGCSVEYVYDAQYKPALRDVTPQQYLVDSCVWVPDFEVSAGIVGHGSKLGRQLATYVTEALRWKEVNATNSPDNPCGPEGIVVRGEVRRWDEKGVFLGGALLGLNPYGGPLFATKGRTVVVAGAVVRGDRTQSTFLWGTGKEENCDAFWFTDDAKAVEDCSRIYLAPILAKQILTGQSPTQGPTSWEGAPVEPTPIQ